jgi:hypothetical protein
MKILSQEDICALADLDEFSKEKNSEWKPLVYDNIK